jgi:hypothetical protein
VITACPIDNAGVYPVRVFDSTHAVVKCERCGALWTDQNGCYSPEENPAHAAVKAALPARVDGPMLENCPYDNRRLRIVETIDYADMARFKCRDGCLFEVVQKYR